MCIEFTLTGNVQYLFGGGALNFMLPIEAEGLPVS